MVSIEALLLWKQCFYRSVSEAGEEVDEAVLVGVRVPLLVGQTEEKAKQSVVADLCVKAFGGAETETAEPAQFGSRV
jgi:hypothetical protein